MLEKYSFVVIDIALKIFFFVYTYQTSLLLETQDFDMLSYVRNTIVMFSALSTTAIGLYYINYFQDIKNENIYAYYTLGILTYITILVIVIIILFFFQDRLHISSFIDIVDFLFIVLMLLVISLCQLFVFIAKANGNISTKIIKSILLLIVTFTVIGTFIIIKYKLLGAIYYFVAVYIGLCLVFLNKNIFLNINNFKINKKYFFEKLKIFIVPNFLESVLSIIAPWSMIYILTAFNGFNGVGDLLFYQALLGLSTFFVYSLSLNNFNRIEKDIENIREYISKALSNYFKITMIVLFIIGMFSAELLKVFHFRTLSELNLIFLILGVVIQNQITVTSIIFKRIELSKRTLLHNFILSICLVGFSYILIRNYSIEGYGFAYLLTWMTVYAVILYDFHKYIQFKPYRFLVNFLLLSFVFLTIYFLFKFIVINIIVKLLFVLTLCVILFLNFRKKRLNESI